MDIIAVLLILAVIAFAGYKFVSGRNAAAEAPPRIPVTFQVKVEGVPAELYESCVEHLPSPLMASGAQMVLFTTGRGTPFGAPAPTMKIATNTPLATKKSNWIDFNAGVVADGTRTLDEAAQDLMDLVLETASGKQTRAEEKGFREISIFKDGVVL